MQHVWKDANFGLASPDDAGRQAALEFTRLLHRDLGQLCELSGRAWWRECSYTRLLLVWLMAMLLSVRLSSCWIGTGCAKLVIEHCDKFIEQRKPEKGFLSLETEIEVVSQFGIGLHINWGRSVVEGRQAETAYQHVLAAGESGVLDGLLFSGAGPEETQVWLWLD